MLKVLISATFALSMTAVAAAQEPTCKGCPGTYIGSEELEAYAAAGEGGEHHRPAGAGGGRREVERRHRHGAPGQADRVRVKWPSTTS